jgi:hypothetical protein
MNLMVNLVPHSLDMEEDKNSDEEQKKDRSTMPKQRAVGFNIPTEQEKDRYSNDYLPIDVYECNLESNSDLSITDILNDEKKIQEELPDRKEETKIPQIQSQTKSCKSKSGNCEFQKIIFC